MSPKGKGRMTMAALVAGATTVATTLGLLANGVVSLNERVGTGASQADSLARSDSILFTQDSLLWREVRAINRALGRRTGAWSPARPAVPQQEGLVRRVWRLLF